VKLPKGVEPPQAAAGSARAAKVTFSGAQRVAATLAKLDGPAARRLRTNRLARSAAGAQRLAVSLALGGSPRGALAALLVASERNGRDSLAVMNAGVMLLRLGKPAEALAFFDRAKGLRGPSGIGLRVSRAAAIEANRAAALLALGRNSDAASAARRAIARSPYLVEARETLAVALACDGRAQEAKCELSAGNRRPLGPDEDRPPCAVAARLESPNDLGDQRLGVPGELPGIEYPPFADKGPAYVAYFQSLREKSQSVGDAALRASAAADQRAQAALQRMNSATRRRTSNLVNAIRSVPRDSDLVAKERAAQALAKKLDEINTETANAVAKIIRDCAEGGQTCVREKCRPYVLQQHDVWYRNARAFERELRAWWKERFRRATALLANIASQPWHAQLAAELEGLRMAAFGRLIDIGTPWAAAMQTVKPLCLDPLPDAAASAPAVSPSRKPDPCPPALAQLKFEVDLTVAKLAVNCSEVSLGIGTEAAPLIGAFGKATYSFKDGTTTLYGGAKAGKFGVSFESGIYVKFDSKGSLHDVGWKTGPKGFGKSDVQTMSFVASAAPASASALPTFGPPR
jgi:hypothetical protein